MTRAVAEFECVREEDRIEAAGFRALCEIDEIADVGERLARRARMAPTRLMMPAAVYEQIEMDAS